MARTCGPSQRARGLRPSQEAREGRVTPGKWGTRTASRAAVTGCERRLTIGRRPTIRHSNAEGFGPATYSSSTWTGDRRGAKAMKPPPAAWMSQWEGVSPTPLGGRQPDPFGRAPARPLWEGASPTPLGGRQPDPFGRAPARPLWEDEARPLWEGVSPTPLGGRQPDPFGRAKPDPFGRAPARPLWEGEARPLWEGVSPTPLGGRQPDPFASRRRAPCEGRQARAHLASRRRALEGSATTNPL
jgi:hypothetical protein